MSGWLIVFVGLIYLGIALEQTHKGNMGLAIMYFGYAMGNAGIYLIEKGYAK